MQSLLNSVECFVGMSLLEITSEDIVHCFPHVLCAADPDWSRLEELDKPNEQLAAVWALVPPTPPRPSPQPITRRQQEMDSEKGVQKGSRFAEFMKEKGGRGWKLPESLPQKPSRRISPPRHYEEPSYAARASYPIHSRL